MVGNNLYYKRYIEKMIETYGHNIMIKRKVKTDDGFGGFQVEDKTIEERVVFYNKKLSVQTILDAGTKWSSTTAIKILSMGDADLQEGDKIEINGKEYKINNLVPYLSICTQSELERIE